MSALQAVVAARNAGIDIATDGGDLVLEARAPPTAELLERLRKHKTAIVELLRPRADGWSAEDWQAYFNEHAAIAEFHGGLPRPQAEAQAFSECVTEWLNRARAIGVEAHPPELQPCPKCWLAWQKQAAAAIGAMGVPSPIESRDDAAREGVVQ
jgi:hypothetical protein